VSTASKSDAIRPTRPLCRKHGGASAPSNARANSKAKGSCSQGNSRGLLEPYGQSALRGRCESVGHRLIPTFGPLGHEPLRWWRCAYHRLSASIPPGSGAPDGYSGCPLLAQLASPTAPKNRIGRCTLTPDCYDNAVADRFFWSLTHEWTKFACNVNRDEARISAFKYIETFYNPAHLHQTLIYHSADHFERKKPHP